MIRARGLTRRFGSKRVLEDVDLDLARGSFAVVTGPNGSGKTTLLRVLSGVVSPEAGDIRLGGRPLRSIPPRERARLVAVVFQETQVLFNFSVLEIALMGRAPHLGPWGLERPEDFDAARTALRDMDLADQEDKHLQELSSGERQRALLARTLAQEPRILLMDEPTAFLDLKHRLQIYEILARRSAPPKGPGTASTARATGPPRKCSASSRTRRSSRAQSSAGGYSRSPSRTGPSRPSKADTEV